MRRALLATLLLCSCHEERAASFPEPDEGTRSMLLGLALPAGGVRVEAFAWPDERPGQLGIATNTDISVLFYTATLDELGIRPGPVTDARGEMNNRRLPLPDQAFAATVLASGLGTWEPRNTIDDELASFRIAGGSVATCAEAGGCFVSEADVAAGSCAATCPEPTRPDPPGTPMPPEAPDFGTCPDGWQTVDVDGIAACRPPARDCVGNQFIGDVTCGDVGAACDASGWPVVVPNDRPVRYVDATVAPGGAGTREDPHDTIAAAIDGAPASVAIALKRGTHVDPARTFSGLVQFVGGCAEETTIQLGGPWAITGAASELGFADVTIGRGTITANAAKLTAERTIFTGGGGIRAPHVTGTDVTFDRVVFDAPLGVAVQLDSGTLTATNLLIRDGPQDGLRFDGAVDATLTDVVVERTGGPAVRALSGATVGITRGYFAEATGSTIYVASADVSMDYVVIEDGVAQDRRDGRGIFSTGTSTVLLEHSWITRVITSAAWFESTQATLRNVLIRDVATEPDRGWHGMAVNASSGASLTLDHVDIADSNRWGVLVEGRASLDADHLKILGVGRGASGDTNSVGVEVRSGASAVLDRIVVGGTVTSAMAFDDGEAESQADCSEEVRTGMLRVTDAELFGTESASPYYGIEVGCEAEPTFRRVLVRNVRGWGLDVTQSAKVTLDGFEVIDARIRGLGIFYDGRINGTGVRVTSSRYGITAGWRGLINLSNVWVDCGEEGTLGFGQDQFGEIEVDAFEVQNCEVAVYGYASEFVRLQDGYVHDNAIAVESDAGVEKFLLGVRYENNGRLENTYVPERF
ncbi:MAG: right-handed parallel beta-helix repeat-containing protein [Deltaproteobacteria bacterium]